MKDIEIVKYKKELWVNSLTIAEKFGKRHDSIKRDIDNIIKSIELSTKLRSVKFPPKFRNTKYKNSMNVEYDCVLLNEPAYSLLVMGMTGQKAMETKLLFNDAFYNMKEFIQRQDNEEYLKLTAQSKVVRRELTDALKEFVEYAETQGSESAIWYYKHMSNATYKALGLVEKQKEYGADLRKALTNLEIHQLIMAEMVAEHVLLQGVEKGLHYKAIYMMAKDSVVDFCNTQRRIGLIRE